MKDASSRMFLVVLLLVGVWVVTYWFYEPAAARFPAATMDGATQPVTQNGPIAASSSGASPVPPPATDSSAVPPATKITLDPPRETASTPTRTPEALATITMIERPQFREYSVQKGDTSWKAIAGRSEVFGDRSKWEIVARANPLVSEDRLKPGRTILRIPLDPDNIQGRVVEVPQRALKGAESTPQANPSVPASTPPPAEKTYVIVPGDSLWTIAEKMYGKGAKWRVIYDANRDVLKDPDRPPNGATLRIPALTDTASAGSTS